MTVSRRRLLSAITAAGSALAAPAILRRPANAAEFNYKLASVLPDGHPMVIRSKEAAEKVAQDSAGRLKITVYDNSVLGQDTAMIAQAIAGALEMCTMSVDLLASRNRACGVIGVGYAFADYDQAWAAMDGELGNYVRGLAEGLGLYCIEKSFNHGFRQITARNRPIEKPADLRGFKMRLPYAPSLITLFRHLGASPTMINGGEMYSALETGVVDGQENPLILIDVARLYEVEKYCSVTSHAWMGLHVCLNVGAWKRLPPDLQEIVTKNFTQAAMAQRADWLKMDQTEMQNLKDKGLAFNTPDTRPFRDALQQSGFYPEMKQAVGDKAWTLLEKYSGPLV
jgi:TRAP-type transport system periplasmic protein